MIGENQKLSIKINDQKTCIAYPLCLHLSLIFPTTGSHTYFVSPDKADL